MKHLQLALLALFSGVLLSLPWLGVLPGWILFVSFLPLLIVEDYFFENRINYRGIVFFSYAFLSFFVWNLLSCWWILHATLVGMILVVTLNSCLMAAVWWLYHSFKRKVGTRLGGLALVVFWLAFEYFHFNWEMAWPWLTLGNGFANQVKMVQWYELSGVLGGSLWVLLANWVIFKIYRRLTSGELLTVILPGIQFLFIIGLPVIYSALLYKNVNEGKSKLEVVILQPNVDPYTEKFDEGSEKGQVQRLLNLGDSLVTDATDYLLGPETAIPPIWENERIADHPYIHPFKKMVTEHPNLKIVLGATTQKLFGINELKPATVRKTEDGQGYFDVYNSAIQIDASDTVQYYHKSILVSGVEKMPFSKYFSFLERYIVDLGGTTGSLGSQEEPSVFYGENNLKVAPIVCFESVFGGYLTKFVKKGANVIFIITNDGWWRDTDGYRQHLSFARLRAIETRRDIARSGNTGISAIISQRGDIVQKTSWWKKTAIKGSVYPNDEETFYVRYGDYIGRIAAFIAVLLLTYLISRATILENEKIRTNSFVQNP